MRLAIVIVVLAIVAAVAIAVVYPMTLQPKITMTDSSQYTSGCGLFGPYYYVFNWHFNLTNTGNADGFATVTYYVNNNAVGSNDYFVPQGTTVAKSQSVQGTTQSGWPCTTEYPNIAVTNVRKA